MILVTGGTGLVGSHLLYHLVNNNEPVKAIYRHERNLEIVKKVFSYYTDDVSLLYNKVTWVQADLLDIPTLTEAFNDITHVYHCAAFVSFEPNKYHLLRRTNIEGTANIVNLSISTNVKKLCYVSSVATLGDPKKNTATNENTFWNPEADNSVYSITKYGAEMEVWRGTQEGLDAVIVNPGLIIGGGIWNHGSGYIFKKVYNGLTYYTKGKVGYVGVNDVVLIMIKLMQSDIKNERFILVSENITYKTFLSLVAKQLDVKPPSKEAGTFLLQLGWRLDWLYNKITGKRRSLSKQLAKTLVSDSAYNNAKVKAALNYSFLPIEDAVSKVSKQFLKDQ